MIVNPESYKRGRYGDISATARIVIKCDKCSKEWQAAYSNYKQNIKNRIYKEDFCQACKNSAGICGIKGKGHSEETKRKLSLNRAGKNNSFYGKTHSKSQKEKWSVSRKGRSCRPIPMSKSEKKRRSAIGKAYWDALTEEEKVARLAKNNYSLILKKLLCNGGLYSGLHKKVKKDMNSEELLNFISEEKIGRYVYDEVSHELKIVIEINGDYWHANPKKYNKNQKIAYPKGIIEAQEVWAKDDKKIGFAESLGFIVYVLWEQDVHNGSHLPILRRIKNGG
tara:strand:+ start:5994 stop:6833 length:840 start_codon:yes stop_codon:yes gene_type:complete